MEESKDWGEELYQDYTGPIIVRDEAGQRKGFVGRFIQLHPHAAHAARPAPHNDERPRKDSGPASLL